jgi:hypothetical protein
MKNATTFSTKTVSFNGLPTMMTVHCVAQTYCESMVVCRQEYGFEDEAAWHCCCVVSFLPYCQRTPALRLRWSIKQWLASCSIISKAQKNAATDD